MADVGAHILLLDGYAFVEESRILRVALPDPVPLQLGGSDVDLRELGAVDRL